MFGRPFGTPFIVTISGSLKIKEILCEYIFHDYFISNVNDMNNNCLLNDLVSYTLSQYFLVF